MRSNVENEALGAAAGLRGAKNVGGDIKGRMTRATRTAMTDIGNKTSILQNLKNANSKGKISEVET